MHNESPRNDRPFLLVNCAVVAKEHHLFGGGDREDPFELNNLAADPAYREQRQRLALALAQRFAEVGDWSDEPEAEMAQRFWPDGQQPLTDPPRATIQAGELVLEPATPGSSLGYRVGEGSWQLYSKPVAVETGVEVSAKAVRYGWQESTPVTLTSPGS